MRQAGGAALLATLRAGDVIITAKLDRMFRSPLNSAPCRSSPVSSVDQCR